MKYEFTGWKALAIVVVVSGLLWAMGAAFVHADSVLVFAHRRVADATLGDVSILIVFASLMLRGSSR